MPVHKRGTGQALELPIGENDVLTALAKTGGMPGIDAINEVVIERQRPETPPDGDAKGAAAKPPADPKVAVKKAPVKYVKQYIRIPLRLRPGDPEPHPVRKSGFRASIEASDRSRQRVRREWTQ